MAIKLNYHRFYDLGTTIEFKSSSPRLTFSVSCSHWREGVDMWYNITVYLDPINVSASSQSYYGLGIYTNLYLPGSSTPITGGTLKEPSPSYWTDTKVWSSGNFKVSNVISGTQQIYLQLSNNREDHTYDFYLPVDPANFTTQPKLELTSKTETTLTYKWTTSQTCSNIVWSGDGTKTTTGVPGTTGTLTVTGLTAGETYSHKGLFTRQDSGLSLENAVTPVTTDKYPYVEKADVNPFIIGNSVNLTLSNPHNRQITVYIKSGDTTLFSTQTEGKTTGAISLSANTLYSLIPSSTSGTLKCYCMYGDIKSDDYDLNFTYRGDEYPTFTTDNWSYVANLTSLTHNNQVVINGYSDVTITVDEDATSEYGATIKSYNATWGKQGVVNEDGTITISKGTGNSITCTAIDGRDLPSNTTDGTLALGDNYIPYTSPIIRNMDTTRNNGVDTLTYLTASGTFYATTFGSDGETNTLITPKYYVKTNDSSEWIGPFDVNTTGNDVLTVDTENGIWNIKNASIHLDGTSGGFPINSSYNVKLIIADGLGLLGSAEYTSDINDGKLARDVYKDSSGEYHEGINGLADNDYTQTIHGDININGDVYQNGEIFKSGPDKSELVDMIYPVGAIYISALSTSPASLFSGTEWVQLKARYLYATGQDQNTGNACGKDNVSTYTGTGALSHAITINEMPSHKHDDNIATAAWGWQSYCSGFMVGDGIGGYAWGSETLKGGNAGHTHNVSYIAVYIWQRTK